MKIRTKLLLAFFALAVVPMTVIVLVGYVSSERAVRQAVEEEASLLASDMTSRLDEVRDEMRERVERVGALPFTRLVEVDQASGSDQGSDQRRFLAALAGELGDAAELVESLEFVPEGPRPPGPPQVAELSHEEHSEAPQAPQTVVIQMHQVMQRLEQQLGTIDDEKQRQEARHQAEEGLAAAAAAIEMLAQKVESEAEERATEWKITFERQQVALAEEERARLEEREVQEARDRAAYTLEQPTAELYPDPGSIHFDFGSALAAPVREEGEIVGELRARIRGEELLRRVLGRIRRTQGEVPFAIGSDGELFTLDDDDREVLAGLPVVSAVHEERPLDDWVVVTTDAPASEMSLGIARPIRDSLAEVRRTAFRNFGFGIGLIGLALLGVIPVTRRLSANVREVTAAAEKIADGDLSIRVPVRSGDEIGQLAAAFNTMTTDLSAHQARLIEEERARRDSEVERQLLQAEIARQTAELEEARRFQLSLLPKTLPEHDSFELAVEMRTATEVGGDYYDFQLGSGGVLTAAVGDATGHGARAGTMVTVIKSLFSAYPPGDSLADFLSEAGGAIRRMDLGRMAMALTLVRLQSHRLTIAAAGMPPALLYRSASRGVEEVQTAGMPLGSFATGYGETTVAVDPGDTLLLMSDGLPELPSPAGEPLGYERAREAFARCAEAGPAEIVGSLTRIAASWAGETAPADDVTFVALRVR